MQIDILFWLITLPLILFLVVYLIWQQYQYKKCDRHPLSGLDKCCIRNVLKQQCIERLRVRCLFTGGEDILKCFVCRFFVYAVNLISSKHLRSPFWALFSADLLLISGTSWHCFSNTREPRQCPRVSCRCSNAWQLPVAHWRGETLSLPSALNSQVCIAVRYFSYYY